MGRRIFTFIYATVFVCVIGKTQHNQTVSSPDGNIQLTFINDTGMAQWSVSYKEQIIILPSATGFILDGDVDLSHGFIITNTEKSTFQETWNAVWGPDKVIESHYNQMICHLQHEKEEILISIEFRLFNDGLGFRYIFPEQQNLKDFVIMDELTEFTFAEDHQAWWIVADFDSYEKLYNDTPLSEVSWANTPITFLSAKGLYLSIHEAMLLDYAEMTLQKKDGEILTFTSALAPWADGTKVKTSAPMSTPWRTLQISETAAGLIESNLIVNLNEPCKIEDVSWIRPMKYIGIWWGFHVGTHTWAEGERQGATTEEVKRYIDFAAVNDIQGVVVEGWNKGWDSWGARGAFDYMTPASGYDLEEVAAYARKKGIYLIMHHETGGDAEGYEALMEDAFALCRKLDIHALKTGYAGGIYPRGENHHGQFMVRHYQKVVETAAKYQLMLNVHEPVKPTGLWRTWPNMMTREGVRGMEWNAWSEGNPPSHNVTLPFTRMLAGPLDYTPGIFDVLIENTPLPRVAWNFNIDDISRTRIHSTLVHQIALFFILYSPMQMASDLIENYEHHPAFEAIRSAPADWDEYRVLNGEIGEYITVARRSGKEWWIACATNEEGRFIEFPANFLEPYTSYEFTMYADGDSAHWISQPLDYNITQGRILSGDTMKLIIAPGGGAVVRIKETK
jgi:alpha-glucosidase